MDQGLGKRKRPTVVVASMETGSWDTEAGWRGNGISSFGRGLGGKVQRAETKQVKRRQFPGASWASWVEGRREAGVEGEVKGNSDRGASSLASPRHWPTIYGSEDHLWI